MGRNIYLINQSLLKNQKFKISISKINKKQFKKEKDMSHKYQN